MVETVKFLNNIYLYYKDYKTKIIVCFFISMIVGATNILSPIVLLRIFDKGIENKSVKMTLIYSGVFVVIAITNSIMDYIYSKLSVSFERSMATDLRLQLVNKLGKYNGNFFSELDNGELYTLLYSDVEKIPRVITGHTLNLLRNILTLFGLSIFLSSLNYKLLIILLLFQIIIIKTQTYFNKVIERENEDFRSELIEKNKFAQEMVNNFIQIISANLLINTYKRIERSEDRYNKKWTELTVAMKKNDIVIYLLNTLMIAVILTVGGIEVIRGMLTMGALITFNIFSQRFCNPIVQIYKFPTDIIDSKISWDKINKQLLNEKEMSDINTYYDLCGDIELVRVNYSYGEKQILTDCTLRIKQNNSYAIVGKSGAGKTTMAKLIYRIIEANEGEIIIDGHNIKKIGIDNIRNQISYISQEAYILNGTLKENLSVRNDTTEEDIINTLEKVCLGPWYKKLDEGLCTNLGDNGVKLSGGEKQRIAMARALLRNSNIIIMDESTSMLDEKTELRIIDLITTVFKNKTVIMITHKKTVAKKLDNIIEVENGKVRYIDKVAY